MTYVPSQNPNSSYSNNQNPPSSYLNNQNATPPALGTSKASGTRTANKPRNKAEELLRKLFPGKMIDVKVQPMSLNPNPIATAKMGNPPTQFGAWTQSSKLIYYRDDVDDDNLVMAYTLKHEGLHVLQFEKNNDTPPSSFSEMSAFESKTYPQTDDWLQKAIPELERLNFDPKGNDKKLYNDLIKESKQFTQAMSNVHRKSVLGFIGQFALRVGLLGLRSFIPSKITRATKSLFSDRIFFINMAKSEFIPDARNVASIDPDTGQTVLKTLWYEAKDMYRENKPEDLKIYKELGF